MDRILMSTQKGAHYFPFIKKISLISSMLLLLFFLVYFITAPTMINEIEEEFRETYLHIRDGRTQELLFSRHMKINETFILDYIHSVTNQQVLEFYRVYNQQQIELYEMRFDEFGPNLPIGAEKIDDAWTEFIVTDEYYQVKYHNRLFERIPLQVGKVIARHTLKFADGEELLLENILRSGSYIVVSVTNERMD